MRAARVSWRLALLRLEYAPVTQLILRLDNRRLATKVTIRENCLKRK